MSDAAAPYMSQADIAAFTPDAPPVGDPRAGLRTALKRHGRYGANQTAGRFYPGACAAIEVTQRCNLDCSLCYLSEAAELSHDPPLDLLLSRIDMLARHFGAGANIQITGGDPTLRKLEDLEALIARVRSHGMRACLMTNGIRAKRPFLKRLAAAGLNDVAFHVDLTEERKGYATEEALNEVRLDYLERARGLGLRILFNTTIFDGNIDEIPMLTAFFRDHAAEITLAGFQMQADTGRGVLRKRGEALTQDRVIKAIEVGFGGPLHFDAAAIAHEACNRYAHVLAGDGAGVSLLSDQRLFEDIVGALEREDQGGAAFTDLAPAFARIILRRPLLGVRLAAFAASSMWRMRGPLWRRKAGRMSITIHNFMDAASLEAERCETCIFKVATEEGPLSMCVHNARRDQHLFTPARTEEGWWSAATGEVTAEPAFAMPDVKAAPLKRLKGRERAAVIATHPNKRRKPVRKPAPEPSKIAAE